MIGVRRPRLAGRCRRIMPVEAFAAGDRRAQSVRIIRAGEAVRIAAEMVGVPPVRQRHVIVDADCVDRRMRPERVEVEEHIAAAVGRLVAEILAPVGAVADLGRAADDRTHVRRQVAQRLHERKGVVHRRAAWSARAARNRPGRRRRRRLPPRASHSAAPAADSPSRPGGRQSRSCRRRWKNRQWPRFRQMHPTCVARRRRLVGGTGHARRRIAGDAPAPGIGRLTRAAVGVRQRVAVRYVHHHERIERHLQPAPP